VRASDNLGAQSPGYGESLDLLKVDKTKPNAPSAAADRSPDYAGGGGWYKNTVTVSFTSNGDPNLADGSAGSGVASVSAQQTFNTSGSHTASGTATDNAGNFSLATTLNVQVDATKPSVNITCPSSVVLGSSANASRTASDAHSGLATAASGTVALNTSSVGSKTASAPTATDNVCLTTSRA